MERAWETVPGGSLAMPTGLPRSVLDDLGEEVTGIIAPVSLCMLITVILVRLLNPDGAGSSANAVVIASLAYSEDTADSGSQKFGGALLNALIFVGIITVMTFVLVLLFKYGCFKIIYGYMAFAVFDIFFLVTGLVALQVLQAIDLHVDAFSFVFGMFNFSVVGTLGVLFMPIPLLLKQFYMLWTGVIVAYIFTWVPEWTAWVLLAVMAVYDILAVLIPGGPLNMLIQVAESRSEMLPALVYEARPARGPYQPNHMTRRGPPPPGGDDSVRNSSGGGAQSSGRSDVEAPLAQPLLPLSQPSGTAPHSWQPSGQEQGVAARPVGQGGAGRVSGPRAQNPASEPRISPRLRMEPATGPLLGNSSAKVRPMSGLQRTSSESTHKLLAGASGSDAARGRSGGIGSLRTDQELSSSPARAREEEEPKGGPVGEALEEERPGPTWTALPSGPPTSEGSASAAGPSQQAHPPGGADPGPQAGALAIPAPLAMGAGSPRDAPEPVEWQPGDAPGFVPQADRQGGAPVREVPRDPNEFEIQIPDSIKLGLGDFIFYSLLVGRAAMYDYMTVFASYLGIIAGLGITLLCLTVYQRALPALPFSIALGIIFYFLTRILLEPYIVPLVVALVFF